MTITVNNLPPEFADVDLRALFEEYGAVQDLQSIPGTNSALITLVDPQEEKIAFGKLNGKEWHGKVLALELEPVLDGDSSTGDAKPSGEDDPPRTTSNGDRGIDDPPRTTTPPPPPPA